MNFPTNRHLCCQVLQGFMFLGHLEELGGEVASAFTNAVNATVIQVQLHKNCKCTLVLQLGLDVDEHPCEILTQLLHVVPPSNLMQQLV